MNPSAFSQVNTVGTPAAAAGVLSAADGVAYAAIAVFIISIIWLSHREMKISRKKSTESEKMLETERDSLERKISERTAALVRAEGEHMAELERNALFGKLSRGLFHDLMSPLSSLTLYAEQMKGRADVGDVGQDMAQKMITASKRIGSYMESVRRCFSEDIVIADVADLSREIEIVRDVLGYKARMAGVDIFVDQKDHIELPLNPVRLHQLLLNLVSNAIDACEEKTRGGAFEYKVEQKVAISVRKNSENITLSVADSGIGIPPEKLKQLFKKSFTTKSKGSGLGLTTISSIVEQDLKGKIEVESTEGVGTTFIVHIPCNLQQYLNAEKF